MLIWRYLSYFHVCILFFGTIDASGAERVILYNDLPALIKSRNENAQAAESNLKAQQERTGFLTRSFLPQFSASLGTEQFKTDSIPTVQKNNWQLKGRMNLFRGGQDRLENEIRKSNELRAQAEYGFEINHELKAARESYWKIVEVSQLITYQKEAIERNESFLYSSKKRAGAGVATSSDALQFELHRTLLNQSLKKLNIEDDLLKNRLAVSLGLDEHENIKVQKDFPHPPEKIQTEVLNLENNFEVQTLKTIEMGESLRKSQSSRWWLPKVDLYSGYGIPTLSEEFERAQLQDREWSLGLALVIDLGENISNYSESKAKRFEAQAAQKRLAQKTREIKSIDHEARLNLNLMHELIHDADADVSKSECFLKITQNEYARGVKNGPDLLEAFKQLFEFRYRRAGLYREYYITQAELLALSGIEKTP